MLKESFVQESLENYFIKMGYECKHEKRGIDLIVTKNGVVKWIIEAKGETSDTRTDFCTCVGQLLGKINDPIKSYGLAIPKTEKHIYQAKQLSKYVRKQLNIFILLVDESGCVEIIEPKDIIE
jgi:4-hydroxyphenylpyruvate dioxygenase-like putative hemolysin